MSTRISYQIGCFLITHSLKRILYQRSHVSAIYLLLKCRFRITVDQFYKRIYCFHSITILHMWCLPWRIKAVVCVHTIIDQCPQHFWSIHNCNYNNNDAQLVCGVVSLSICQFHIAWVSFGLVGRCKDVLLDSKRPHVLYTKLRPGISFRTKRKQNKSQRTAAVYSSKSKVWSG